VPEWAVVSAERHDDEIHENLAHWQKKPLLRDVYRGFYEQIAAHLLPSEKGKTVELGSGIGNLKSVLPDCVATDLFPNPWIDRVENAYRLGFEDASLTNLVLFDVFHHLQYPGTALDELARVLADRGRLVLFEPDISALGAVVYGVFHHEPVAWRDPIAWRAPAGWSPERAPYYAAQGNAARIFRSRRVRSMLGEQWKLVEVTRLASLSYVASGGFRGRQLYPDALYPVMKRMDRVANRLPSLFSTRLLVVLERASRDTRSRPT
jgi:SAM-dependent methyltransferase